MGFNSELKTKVLKKVIKKPRTAQEIGAPIGYDGRGIGRVLGELVKDGSIKKDATKRPPTYTKA